MRATRFIISFIVLILTILVTKSSKSETTCTENDLGDQTCITTTTTSVPGVTTDNLVSQEFLDGSWTYNNSSNHGTGTIAGVDGQYFETTVSLNNDANLTKEEINSGFSSTFGADIWFWTSNTNQNVILKQTLTDDNGNIITQQRTINHNSNFFQTHTDTIIVNSNSQQDYDITARIEVNVPGVYGHGGADIRSPTLNVTTNGSTETTTTETFTYCYDRVPNACTYDNQALEEVSNLTTDTGQTYDQFIEQEVNTVNIEEFTVVDTTIIIEDDLGNVEELSVEEFTEQNFETFIATNNLTETFETALVEENITEEEFYNEMSNELEQEFSNDLTTQSETEDLNTNTETETTDIEDANADTNTTKETEEVSNETNEESTSTETVSNESNVDENKETEGSEAQTNNNETVENEEVGDVKAENVAANSIEKKVEKVIQKVLAKLKSVDKKLQAVQFLTTKGLTAGQADVSSYINKRIYINKNQLSDPLADDFLQKINILEQQQIYKEVNLNTYESNDPIAVKQKALYDIVQEINRLEIELKVLKQKG